MDSICPRTPGGINEHRVPDEHQSVRAGGFTWNWLAPDIHFQDFNAVQRPAGYWNGSGDVCRSVGRSIEYAEWLGAGADRGRNIDRRRGAEVWRGEDYHSRNGSAERQGGSHDTDGERPVSCTRRWRHGDEALIC
jgi:hypothetical protein